MSADEVLAALDDFGPAGCQWSTRRDGPCDALASHRVSHLCCGHMVRLCKLHGDVLLALVIRSLGSATCAACSAKMRSHLLKFDLIGGAK